MPPRAVWKIRPVGGRAEPLDVRAEQPDQDRGMGMVRVHWIRSTGFEVHFLH